MITLKSLKERIAKALGPKPVHPDAPLQRLRQTLINELDHAVHDHHVNQLKLEYRQALHEMYTARVARLHAEIASLPDGGQP